MSTRRTSQHAFERRLVPLGVAMLEGDVPYDVPQSLNADLRPQQVTPTPLMADAAELLSVSPKIEKVDVLGSKLRG